MTKEEQEALLQVSQLIEDTIVRKLENFHSCYPYGYPRDDLKVTIKLFNMVSRRGVVGTATGGRRITGALAVGVVEGKKIAVLKSRREVLYNSTVNVLSKVVVWAMCCSKHSTVVYLALWPIRPPPPQVYKLSVVTVTVWHPGVRWSDPTQ